jgi:exonuclease VII large subunit
MSSPALISDTLCSAPFFREKLSHIKTRLNFLSPQNKLNENKRRLADIEDALERIMKQRLSEVIKDEQRK